MTQQTFRRIQGIKNMIKHSQKNTALSLILFAFQISAIFYGNYTYCQQHKSFNEKVSWEKGYLDIHQIHTGRGDASFMIFPDGTTLLYDAGEADQKRTKYPYFNIYPNEKKTAGEWLVNYIKQVAPNHKIDYAIISHFHADHYGSVNASNPISINKQYQLSGIATVGDAIKINTLIDRGYPDYNYPMDLRSHFAKADATFDNYLKFINYQVAKNGMKVQRMWVGSNQQVILKYAKKSYPDFFVQNIKSNQRIWTGRDTTCFDYIFLPSLESESDHYSENALSNVIKINYGKFDYYTGGDIPGFPGKGDYDIESPVAKIVGEVDALKLDHHGQKDANNDSLFDLLKPQIVVHSSIHDPHFQESTMNRIASRQIDAYTIWMSDSVQRVFKNVADKIYKSKRGHILIRVAPGGDFFKVLILENKSKKLMVKKIFGPYISRN